MLKTDNPLSNAIVQAIEGASTFTEEQPDGSEPLPLQASPPPGEEYPVHALGPLLGDAAQAIHKSTMAPLGMCAQSVLAAASLATQGLIKVNVAGRFVCVVSLYLLALGNSGERKTRVDRLALAAVRAYQRALHEQYQTELAAFTQEMAEYLKRAKGKKDIDEPPPTPPMEPYFLCDEPTYEAVVKTLHKGRPSVALCADEGAGFLGGHALRPENLIRTITGLSKLWDGDEISRSRAGDGNIVLYDRAFCCYLMIQPALAQKLMLSNSDIDEQGLLARFLVHYPESTMGTRFIECDDEETEHPALVRYHQKIRALLERISFDLAC